MHCGACAPCVAQAHAALTSMGDLTAEHADSMPKRLARASKAGLLAIAAAQPAPAAKL